ncbi:MAG: translocation/assembly module TamB domain-containing protein [Pseudomonadota bacterium]|nr:translocation/assembly module TamB domain-containing protein [Pseudomonadota bacterium]
MSLEDDVPTPAPSPTTSTPAHAVRRWPRVLGRVAGIGLLLTVLLVGALAGGLWWAVRSEAGSAWVVSRLPGVEVTAPRGVLLGDFEAQRVQLALPGGTARIVLTNFGWRGFQLRRSDAPGLWAHLTFADLHAARLDLLLTPSKTKTPSTPPTRLDPPVQVDIAALRIDALYTAALGDKPLRGLRARLQLGAAGGSTHRVDALSAAWEKLKAQGAAHIETHPPFALEAHLDLSQDRVPAAVAPRPEPVPTPPGPVHAPSPAKPAAPPSAPPIDLTAWQATLALSGPLETPALRATVRSPATATHPAQSLDAQAALRPFADWPLADLQASTRALDLSALSPSAPATSLTGRATIQTEALDRPIDARIELSNDAAGRWNEGRLPLRSLNAELVGRADDRTAFDLKRFDAELGTREQSAGRLQGRGHWTAERSTLDASLRALQPSLLDARAPEMLLSGPVSLVALTPRSEAPGSAGTASAPAKAPDTVPGSTPVVARPRVEVRVDLASTLSSAAGRGQVQTAGKTVQLTLDARADSQRIELHEARARAGGASATLTGSATRAAPSEPWQAKGRAALVDFDPLPWWPGREDSPWRRGPHRVNATGDFDVQWPQDSAAPLTSVRGSAQVVIANSVLAGTPVEGQASLRSLDSDHADAALTLQIAGNRLQAQGRFATVVAPGTANAATAGAGRSDHWDLTLDAPVLASFAPLWRLVQPAGSDSTLAGALTASTVVNGRWPELTAQGELTGSALRIGAVTAQQARARWNLGSAEGAPLDVEASATQVRLLASTASGTHGPTKAKPAAPAASPNIESVQFTAKGTVGDHAVELRARSKVLPPAWTEALQASTSMLPATPPPAAAAGIPPDARSTLLLQAQGGAIDRPGQRLAGWRGSLQRFEMKASNNDAAPWIATRDIGIEAQWSGGPAHLTVQPGRADVLGVATRWSRLDWQAALPASGGFSAQPAQIDAQFAFDPLPIAPLLARLQPSFGWGGDLTLSGHLDVHSDGGLVADVVVERARGDLTVTDEIGTQSLGLTALRLALSAQDGVWTFSPYLAGRTLGVLAGAVIARTTPEALWPPADAPIQGAVELDVANLGAWGTWVPAGWRLAGQMKTSALFGGRVGAPEVNGNIQGSSLSVRNFLEGVNVSDGDVSISLRGDSARIERFTAKGGTGSISIEGGASLGETPTAQLQLKADRFVLLGRVDRRIVTSGTAQLGFNRDALNVNGAFSIDEGLIDFTRSDAPALSDDVQVVRAAASGATASSRTGTRQPSAEPAAAAPAARNLALDLKVDLGNQLRLRGRGIETGLRGELRLTAPGGRLAVDGTVRATDGTYAAYGQKLTIDRGLITFSGPPENPRLNIEATRPNTDIRVGVQVTGSALNPRIRLFSEPEVSEIDKLSWLALGRASDGLGTADTALLQTAAMALLAGEGDGITEQFTKAVGLDELTLRQANGEVRETVISLGKQLSRRWYVGYERGLNATEGSWQLIYRIARRFTLRAQSGFENSLDLIWTWRWG